MSVSETGEGVRLTGVEKPLSMLMMVARLSPPSWVPPPTHAWGRYGETWETVDASRVQI